MADTRHCGRCKTDKAPAAFYARTSNTWCRECNVEYHRLRTANAKAYGKEHAARAAAIMDNGNFTRADTPHELEMLAIGTKIVSGCRRPEFALQIITDLWALRSKP